MGGHVDGNETDYECLVREIKEEAGIDYNPKIEEPYVSIKYLLKDYPEEGINKGYISNYYVIYDDLLPNYNNVDLTDDEKEGNLKLELLPINELENIIINNNNTNPRNIYFQKELLTILKFYKSTYKNHV